MLDLDSILRGERLLIDVRAPVEFEEGRFPQSRNLPILDNCERKLVGTCYREKGQAEAIRLGHELVSGRVKESRVAVWTEFLKNHPDALLYCYRGGLRSQISVEWIREAGSPVERIPGGYKALRNHLLKRFEDLVKVRKFRVVGGRTGSGKTAFLSSTALPFLDLEHHANHKGSSFGGNGVQPSQASFENAVMISLLRTPADSPVLIEDESIMVGSRMVPQSLMQKMKQAPLYVLDTPIEERIGIIVRDYVLAKLDQDPSPPSGALGFFLEGLARIQKKLGGLEASRIEREMRAAFGAPDPRDAGVHASWIRALLERYYDPLYERSLERNRDRITLRGDSRSLLAAISTTRENP
ncbi:MAG: tRNA 2-selenouridine(34) synthase MnmH [Proteobacteria bacterium]|nr:tRNA 2-selenouridine(34) synthase MnmH [Pseudomonadota bacterium]